MDPGCKLEQILNQVREMLRELWHDYRDDGTRHKGEKRLVDEYGLKCSRFSERELARCLKKFADMGKEQPGTSCARLASITREVLRGALVFKFSKKSEQTLKRWESCPKHVGCLSKKFGMPDEGVIGLLTEARVMALAHLESWALVQMWRTAGADHEIVLRALLTKYRYLPSRIAAQEGVSLADAHHPTLTVKELIDMAEVSLFNKLVSALKSYDPARSKFETFLWRAVQREVHQFVQRSRGWKPHDAREVSRLSQARRMAAEDKADGTGPSRDEIARKARRSIKWVERWENTLNPTRVILFSELANSEDEECGVSNNSHIDLIGNGEPAFGGNAPLNPAEILDQKEEGEKLVAFRKKLDEALSKLEKSERSVFQWRHMEDRVVPHKEIANRLGLSNGYSRVLDARACAKLRRLLKDWSPSSKIVALPSGGTNPCRRSNIRRYQDEKKLAG